MTGVALRRHCLELAAGCALVAGIAIDGCVGSGQREAVVVLLHLLNRNLPSADGVALLAVGAELTLVNVGMAVLAALADAGEYRLHVTLYAGHRGVHAGQRIFRLIVIELRKSADRFPGACRVAVLAGNIQVSVRAVRAECVLRPGAQRHSRRQKETDREYFQYDPSPHGLAPC